jgi:hypothetical protein
MEEVKRSEEKWKGGRDGDDSCDGGGDDDNGDNGGGDGDDNGHDYDDNNDIVNSDGDNYINKGRTDKTWEMHDTKQEVAVMRVITLVAQEEPEDALMTSERATTASHHRALFRVRKRG